jgi:hypothetical protein
LSMLKTSFQSVVLGAVSFNVMVLGGA